MRLTRDGLFHAKTASLPLPEAKRGTALLWANFRYDTRALWRDITSGKRSFAGPVLVLMVLVVAFLLRGLFFTTYSFSDDFNYAFIVDNMYHGRQDLAFLSRWVNSLNTTNLGYLHELRFGTVYPLLFLRSVFGGHPNVFAGYHLFLSLIQIFAVYLLMRRFFNEEIGLASALLLAMMPMDILYATYILPDSVIPPYMTVSLLLFVTGQDSGSRVRKSLLYFTAGMVFGLAWYSRLYAVLILGVMAAMILYKKKADLWALAFPAGFALVFFLVNLPVHGPAGTWFLDLKAATNAQIIYRRLYPVNTPWKYATYFSRRLLEFTNFIPFTLLAIAGAGAAAGMKGRYRFFPLLWLAGVFFPLEIGTARLTEWTPFHKLERFMTMFSAPLAALGGVLLGRLSSRKSLFFTLIFLIAVLIMISVTYAVPVWGVRS